MVIYKITNMINNKSYVGKKEMMKNFNNYYGSGILIKNSINKYGKENFTKEILETIDNIQDLNNREKYWINYYNTICPNGYNLSQGGDGGDTQTFNPNRLDIISNRKNKLKEIYKTKEFSEAISISTKGKKKSTTEKMKKPKSDEHCHNVGVSIKNKWSNDNEYKEKIMASFKIRWDKYKEKRMKNLEISHCLYCKKEIINYKNLKKRRKFCSKSCSSKHHHSLKLFNN